MPKIVKLVPAFFPLLCFILSASSRRISIHTKDSLLLRQGVYASVFFVAEPARTPGSNLPMQYRFSESGATPPGMKFESYPCNKPAMTVCPQVATANGIFLDGTPEKAGSYKFVITAGDTGGRTASQQFTVIVNPSSADRGTANSRGG